MMLFYSENKSPLLKLVLILRKFWISDIFMDINVCVFVKTNPFNLDHYSWGDCKYYLLALLSGATGCGPSFSV